MDAKQLQRQSYNDSDSYEIPISKYSQRQSQLFAFA